VADNLLQVEVWDYDSSSPGRPLESVTPEGNELKEILETNAMAYATAEQLQQPTWFDLQKNPHLSDGIQSSYRPGGRIQLRIGYDQSGLHTNRQEGEISFELCVVCAEDLANPVVFETPMDAFCILRKSGQEIGSTAVVPNTLNPRWIGERFVISTTPPQESITSAGAASASPVVTVTVEVWSQMAMGRGDFLGCEFEF
jgi:hypothetical protein